MEHFSSKLLLLLFLMTSSLPVMALLPKASSAEPSLLALLIPAQQKQPKTYKYSVFQDRTPLKAQDYFGILDSSDSEESASRDNDLASEKRTEVMEKILDKIYNGLLTVEKGRGMGKKPPRPQAAIRPGHQPVNSLGPANRFVRIGRAEVKSDCGDGRGSAQDSVLTAPPGSSSKVSAVNADSAISGYNDPAHGKAENKRDSEPGVEKSDNIRDFRKKRSLSAMKRRDRFLRFGRGYSPRSRYMRFGRSSATQATDDSNALLPVDESTDIFLPECGNLSPDGFLQIERRESGDSEVDAENRARYMNQLSGLARRSFVRIGRLPSSAFLQRGLLRDGGSGLPHGSLARQRSSGYRLTRAAIVRLGKRLAC